MRSHSDMINFGRYGPYIFAPGVKNFSRRRLHSDIYMHATTDFLKRYFIYTTTAFSTEANICTTQMKITLA